MSLMNLYNLDGYMENIEISDRDCLKFNGSQFDKYSIVSKDFENTKTLVHADRCIVEETEHKPSNNIIVIKKKLLPRRRKKFFDLSNLNEILDEIKTFKRLSENSSTKFIEFYGWSYDDEHIKIYMEWMLMSVSDINKFIHKTYNVYPEEKYYNEQKLDLVMTYVINEVLEALMVCQSLNYYHPDLKADNIMMNQSGQVKLGDFENVVGTITYLPPEFFIGSKD